MSLINYLLLLAIPILSFADIIIRQKKKEQIPTINKIIAIVSLLSFFITVLVDREEERKQEITTQNFETKISNNNLEIGSLELANNKLEFKTTAIQLETEKAKGERDSINYLASKNDLRLSESEVDRITLKYKYLELENENILLKKSMGFEKAKRHSIERAFVSDRLIFHRSHLLDSIRKLDPFNVRVVSVDHGEAINTAYHLSILFEKLGWNVEHNLNEYMDTEYLRRNKLLVGDSLTMKVKTFLLREIGVRIFTCERRTSYISNLLKTHLLASNTYASNFSSIVGTICDDLSLPENTLLVVVSYKPVDELQKIENIIERDSELAAHRRKIFNQEVLEFNSGNRIHRSFFFEKEQISKEQILKYKSIQTIMNYLDPSY